MIQVENIYKSFGPKQVLCDANLTVEEGSIFGLVGINGAGKSTLLRLMAGVLRPEKGRLTADGQPVYDNETIKKKIFFLQDDPYYTSNLTAAAQAGFYSAFYDFDFDVFKRYTDLFALETKKPLRNFSKGMKRQVFISLALACKPKYLLLDESFDGLDPLARLEFKRGLIELQQSGSAVVIASHSLRELEDICDSFALLDSTRVKSFGNIDAAISKLCKFQLVFEGEVNREDFPFECLFYEKTGRVIRLVARGEKQAVLPVLRRMNPIVLDEIPMDFEDLFIYEAGERGYLK